MHDLFLTVIGIILHFNRSHRSFVSDYLRDHRTKLVRTKVGNKCGREPGNCPVIVDRCSVVGGIANQNPEQILEEQNRNGTRFEIQNCTIMKEQ